MDKKILDHYLRTGTYTYAGPYADYFRSLPDDIARLGNLICSQVIHRVTLFQENTNANADLRYGDMTKYPWYRLRCEDDVLLTATAMTAELFRLDERGFISDRDVSKKIVVTCRYVSVLMTAILKAKGIPARSRAGYAPYFLPGVSMDHWINQYWNKNEDRWVTFDADGFFDADILGFDQFDIPEGRFDWSAEAWISIRSGKEKGEHFQYASGLKSLEAVIRGIFYDFHSLMNNEISYEFQPSYIDKKFSSLTEKDLAEIDDLAELLLDPDKNFDKLMEIWETKKKFRILNSPLVGDADQKQ